MQWLQVQQSSQGKFWLNFPRVAEKKEQRSVKFQKRAIPASLWGNAGRMGIPCIAFEARLSQSTTTGTAHLTAPMTLFEGRNSRKENASLKSPNTVLVWPDQKGKKSFQVWGTATELLKLEESKGQWIQTGRSYTFLLPSLQRIPLGTAQNISHLGGP